MGVTDFLGNAWDALVGTPEGTTWTGGDPAPEPGGEFEGTYPELSPQLQQAALEEKLAAMYATAGAGRGLSDSELDREEFWQENPPWGDSSNIFDVPYDIGHQIRSVPGNVWGAWGDGAGLDDFATGPVWDFIKGAATGFPDQTPTPGYDQLTASEMEREQAGLFQPTLEEKLAAMYAAAGVQGDRSRGGAQNVVVTPADRGIWGSLQDAAGWVGEQGQRGLEGASDAWGAIQEGDLSGAIGDFAGAYYDVNRNLLTDVTAPTLSYLAQEGADVAADLGQNIYNNWGGEELLQAVGGFAQDLPGYGLDAARYLGGQGLDAAQWTRGELADLGQQGLGYLGDRVASLQDEAARLGQNLYGWGRDQAGNIADWTTQQAVPYFQQDFIEDVTNIAGGVKDWAVDDAWGEAIQPFYENVLKPAGLDIADWAVDDVYEDIITPLYENYLKPAGLATADWAVDDVGPWLQEEAWPYIRDNLRHDISDVLEAVPAFIRNVAPEGSRVDDWLETGVGGIGTAYDFFTEDVPGSAADLARRGYDYLFDPSQPGFGGGDAPSQAELMQGATSGAGPSATAAATAAAVANMTQGGTGGTQGGVGGAGGGLATAQDVADQIYAAAQGVGGGGLSDLYSQMFDSQRASAQGAYDAQMQGAATAGQASQDYAATILQQGQQAAAQAEAAAAQYYVQGADEAARAYNETVGALNSREQGLIQRYAELAAIEAAGAGDTATEQRRVSAELEALSTQRTSLRHNLIMEGLTEEEARRTTRLDEFEGVRRGRLATDEAALIEMISGLETGRVSQEQAMAEQLATRFSGARAGMQQRMEAAEATLRAQGIEPAAYTAAPGAETQVLLTSQELSMQTLQNRLRDASAAQAIDRQMRGSEIYSAAGRALEDNLFAMRSQLEDSIAQRKGIANLETFDRQADIDIAGAAERGDINLQELAALQASKEAMFGRKTDLFGESELSRIYSRSDYNAALATERAAQQRAMEAAQQQRIIAQAAAAQQAFAGQQSQLQREHEAAMALAGTSGDIATSELATEISQAEGAASEAQRLAEDYIMVNVDGVDVPVDRDWYIEEHLIGSGAGTSTGSDVNLVEMEDGAGNRFFVDVGGVDEFGTPYLSQSAATNPQITGGNVLQAVYGE